jgi:uncharacterized protein DUF6909
MAERRYMTHNAVVSVGPQGPGRGEIDHFMRSYHTLLRSSGEVQIRALLGPYLALNSALHVGARDAAPDLAALTYASLRLPAAIAGARLVLLGQSASVFARHGYAHVLGWRRVTAPGRRRLMLYDGDATLAVLIASPSDIDDLVPMLLAYEIEWNKLHALLGADPALIAALLAAPDDAAAEADLVARAREALGLGEADWARLALLWDGAVLPRLREIARGKKHFAVRLLGGSANDYEQVTEQWWRHVCAGVREAGGPDLDLTERPLYFVSSNTHSLVNLLSGYALAEQETLIDYIREGHPDLWAEYEGIRAQQVRSSWENFLYYVAKKYLQEPGNADARARRTALERAAGITHVTSRQFLDLHAQVIEVARLDPARLDPRLRRPGLERLRDSAALILNIDYPLGWAAYQVLAVVSAHVADLRGVYVMGKAATLNGRIGDVMIANHFYDEHSRNTYLVDNCFIAQDVAPFLVYGTALDNQQAVAVRGTYLQNHRYLDELYTAGYTVVEMEAGPYLDALYEDTYLSRYPEGQRINLYGAPCDVGIIHYASDTPFSQGHNLGERSLSYFGMDATYAAAVAIVRRIFSKELARLEGERDGRAREHEVRPAAARR